MQHAKKTPASATELETMYERCITFKNIFYQAGSMTRGTPIPVIVVGMAAGIAFVMLFSMMFKPDSMLTDEELVSKYSKVPAVSYFLEKYPDANVEIDRNPLDRYFSIRFDVTRQVDPPSQFYTGINLFGILIYTNPYHFSLDTYCGKTGITFQSGLSGTAMLDEREKECFQTSYQGQQFTIAANRVYGNSLGMRQADRVEPQVIEEYWLLKDIISELNESGPQELTIVYRDINPNETTRFLIDNRLHFTQTCLEIVCYDELSSLINLGDDQRSYMIRVFAGNDPFHIVGDSTGDADETGAFEAEVDVGESIPTEVSSDNSVSVIITYNED